jgi:hypothetical protein
MPGDNTIIERIKEFGIDATRLKACLDSKDHWGDMIHAFEYLTVCGVVCDAMVAAEAEREQDHDVSNTPG